MSELLGICAREFVATVAHTKNRPLSNIIGDFISNVLHLFFCKKLEAVFKLLVGGVYKADLALRINKLIPGYIPFLRTLAGYALVVTIFFKPGQGLLKSFFIRKLVVVTDNRSII